MVSFVDLFLLTLNGCFCHFNFFLNIFFKIWWCQVLIVSCWILSTWPMGFLVVSCGLSSCGSWAPECIGFRGGSVSVVCTFSCSTVCGVLVPQPEIQPVSPALQDRFFTTGPPGKSLVYFQCFSNKLIYGFWFSFEYSLLSLRVYSQLNKKLNILFYNR